MSSERKKMKSKTDLELVLNQNVWKKLKNDWCAGANAASRIDSAFSETDPLSEIVWSPDKGFSLKCVDSSFTNKKTSLFRDVEPSSMVLALLQSVAGGSSTTEKPVDDVFIEPIAVICTKSEVSSTDTPSRNPTSDSVNIVPDSEACEEHDDTGPSYNKEKMTSARGKPNLPNGQKENLMNYSQNICTQANIGTATNFEIKGNKSYIISGQVDRRPVGNLLLQADEPEQNSSPRKHCNFPSGQVDSNVRLSEENNSHCESCHRTELVLSGRKRCKQEVMIESKKVKKQIQETSCYLNRESSFMNFVSNMVKGYSLSTQDEEKSLALALDNPNCHLPWNDQKLLTCYKNQEPELGNNLKSIHCPSFENVATRMSHQVGEASKDIELGKRVLGIDATPISCSAGNNNLFRMNMQSNKFEVSKGRHEAGPSLHSPSTRQSKNNDENVESLELYYRKEKYHQSDTSGDLWITRFSPKLTTPLMVFDHHNEKCGSEVPSTYCSVIPHFHKQISHVNNCKVEETGEQSAEEQLFNETSRLQNCFINKEASAVLVDDKLNIDHTSKHKFNAIKSFPRLRDSEPMVSMFAKRLGAIRQCDQTE